MTENLFARISVLANGNENDTFFEIVDVVHFVSFASIYKDGVRYLSMAFTVKECFCIKKLKILILFKNDYHGFIPKEIVKKKKKLRYILCIRTRKQSNFGNSLKGQLYTKTPGKMVKVRNVKIYLNI